MRILVVGCSGSGKSTMGQRLARALGVPHTELDALNWDPGWRNLTDEDPAEFRRRIAAAAVGDAWVMDGNYTKVEGDHWARATDIVWMDTPKWRVMLQVVWRSFRRGVSKRELWPGTGNRELFRRWGESGHPIRWAWDTYAQVRDRYAEWFGAGAFEGRPVHRVRTLRDASSLIARLQSQPASRPASRGVPG